MSFGSNNRLNFLGNQTGSKRAKTIKPGKKSNLIDSTIVDETSPLQMEFLKRRSPLSTQSNDERIGELLNQIKGSDSYQEADANVTEEDIAIENYLMRNLGEDARSTFDAVTASDALGRSSSPEAVSDRNNQPDVGQVNTNVTQEQIDAQQAFQAIIEDGPISKERALNEAINRGDYDTNKITSDDIDSVPTQNLDVDALGDIQELPTDDMSGEPSIESILGDSGLTRDTETDQGIVNSFLSRTDVQKGLAEIGQAFTARNKNSFGYVLGEAAINSAEGEAFNKAVAHFQKEDGDVDNLPASVKNTLTPQQLTQAMTNARQDKLAKDKIEARQDRILQTMLENTNTELKSDERKFLQNEVVRNNMETITESMPDNMKSMFDLNLLMSDPSGNFRGGTIMAKIQEHNPDLYAKLMSDMMYIGRVAKRNQMDVSQAATEFYSRGNQSETERRGDGGNNSKITRAEVTQAIQEQIGDDVEPGDTFTVRGMQMTINESGEVLPVQ